MSPSSGPKPIVAILTADCLDEWLDEIDVSLDEFCEEMMGTWWFNYIQAFQGAGLKSVLFCTSSQVDSPRAFIHRPTGATIRLLPSSSAYGSIKRLRQSMLSSSDRGVGGSFVKRIVVAMLGLAASYLSTPLVLLSRELKRENCCCMLVEQYEDPRFDLSVLMGCLIRLPVFGIFTATSPPEKWWNRFYRPFRSSALRLCAGLAICSGREATRVMLKYGFRANKLARIAFPVDLSIWYPGEARRARVLLGIPATAKVAMYHGSIGCWAKGLDVLVDAWEQLLRDHPAEDLRLILIGTGSDGQKLSDLLAARQLRGVEWLDEWVHERSVLRRYLSAADVYVFPSRVDAFGIAVVEAMACGLPVVAASAPGIPDIFPDGEKSGGIIVPTGNAIALTAAIERVLGDAKYAGELGKSARRRVEAVFSMDTVGNQLHQFLIGNERRP